MSDGRTQLHGYDYTAQRAAWVFLDLHIWTLDDGPDAAKAIAFAVQTALDKTLTVAGGYLDQCHVTGTSFPRDPNPAYGHGVVSIEALIRWTRETETVGASGSVLKTWATVATVRAEVVQQTATEFLTGYGEAEDGSIIFRIRYRPGITTADRVSYSGEVFDLKEITEIGRRRGLELRGPSISPDSDALTKAPSAPKWMSDEARAEWKRVMPDLIARRIITRADLTGIENYCVAVGRIREIEAAMRVQPLDKVLFGMQNRAMQTHRQLAAEYGLSPVSRAREPPMSKSAFPQWIYDGSTIPDPFGYGQEAVDFLRALKHPRGAPFDLATLSQFGVSPQLAAHYADGGWLVRLAQGVYAFPNDDFGVYGALKFLRQRVPGLHVGGKS
eukprot:gene36820-49660_t